MTVAITGEEKYPDDKIDILERAGYGWETRKSFDSFCFFVYFLPTIIITFSLCSSPLTWLLFDLFLPSSILSRGRRFDLEADIEAEIDPALLQFLRWDVILYYVMVFDAIQRPLFFSSVLLLVSLTPHSCPPLPRLKLVEGKDCFILEACFADTVFNTMAQPFSKPNEVRTVRTQHFVDFMCCNFDRKSDIVSFKANMHLHYLCSC